MEPEKGRVTFTGDAIHRIGSNPARHNISYTGPAASEKDVEVTSINPGEYKQKQVG